MNQISNKHIIQYGSVIKVISYRHLESILANRLIWKCYQYYQYKIDRRKKGQKDNIHELVWQGFSSYVLATLKFAFAEKDPSHPLRNLLFCRTCTESTTLHACTLYSVCKVLCYRTMETKRTVNTRAHIMSVTRQYICAHSLSR